MWDLLATTVWQSRVLRVVGRILGLVRYLAVARLLVRVGVARGLLRGSLSKLEERTDDRN